LSGKINILGFFIKQKSVQEQEQKISSGKQRSLKNELRESCLRDQNSTTMVYVKELDEGFKFRKPFADATRAEVVGKRGH